MEKLPVHFPLPLGVIADRRSRAGANLSLFGNFCHKNGIAGKNVMKMLENLSIFLVEIITVHIAMPQNWRRIVL